MLTSREFFNQILKWHSEGRHDLIRVASQKRKQAHRENQKTGATSPGAPVNTTSIDQ